MCVGLPGKVVEVEQDGAGFARVDIQGSLRRVSLALMGEPPKVGEWVVVQLGFAMERMTETEASEALHLLRLLEESVEDELTAAR
jgi:hydrogenase expression/formation protein HypC